MHIVSPQLGIWGNLLGLRGRVVSGGIEGQSGKNMCQGGKPDTGKFHSNYIGMNVRVAPPMRMGA